MAYYFLPAVLFFFNIVTLSFAESESNLTDETSQTDNERDQNGGFISKRFCANGHYSKVFDHTCCQNQSMKNPIEVDFYLHGHDMDSNVCAFELNQTDSDDMPTSLWNQYLCIFKKDGGNSSVLETYKGFTDFMTSTYPDQLKSKILEQIHKTNVVGESEPDEAKRLEIFLMQMYQAEKQVCHKPNKNTTRIKKGFYEAQSSNCKTDDFPNSLGQLHCCKGRYAPMGIPYPPHLGYISNDEIDRITNCSESFVNRQKELNPSFQKAEDDLKTDTTNVPLLAKKPNECIVSCMVGGISQYGSTEDLKIDLEQIKTKLLAKFSQSTRKDLLALLDTYSGKKFYHLPDNSTMTMNEAVKLVESLTDEAKKIYEYCEVHSFMYKMVDLSLFEYCGYKDPLALYKMVTDTDGLYY